jgi:hypothetical protein
MGEDAIEDEGVKGYYDHWDYHGDNEGDGDWDSFIDGVWVLNGVVSEGKGLVEGCYNFVNCRINNSEDAG